MLSWRFIVSKILFVSKNDKKAKQLQEILEKYSYEYIFSDSQIMTIDILKTQAPDIVILDTEVKAFDLKTIIKKIKSFENMLTILLTKSDEIEPELWKNANAFLREPISKNLVIGTIEANLKNKNALEKLSNSNQDLARSLYQLNVLYSTSSQFAGTLDKEKLINIMIDGMDKSLGFGLACALTFRNENEPVLIIHSLYNISDRVLEALKLRTILNYKSMFEHKEMPFELDIENLKIEKHIKHAIKEYDFSVLRSDNMFSPITISENFYGFIEIFREAEFSTEDATCFQTLAQQVSLPLKSANLYEITEKTNKKLEKLERLKSEFISIVSHELRTPLTAIKNSMDIILSGKAGALSETMDKFLNMGRRNVARLSGIINDLLDLSKIEAGKMDFKFEVIKIEPVIDYVKNNLMELAKEKNLELKMTLEDDSADIYADSRRLEQVLTNLVSNAIKFTHEAGKVEIRTRIVDTKDIYPVENFRETQKNLKGKYLEVCVKDNGIGISQEHLTHVFDKFAQIENSLSRNVGGSGLGLPIAKQLLESHNGDIWCNSKPEKGSSFYFVIPIADARNNFLLDLKQNLQKSKVNNSTLVLAQLQSDMEVVKEIKEKVLNDYNLNNSLEETVNKTTSLTIMIPDEDRALADTLKVKLQEFVKLHGNVYPNCAIMFAYGVYPKDALEDVELFKKVNDTLQKIRE